jgi:(S)-2-hydroxy-acid oxidase
MANRHASLDPHILTVRDLQESASKILPKMYNGKFQDDATLISTYKP